MKCVRLFLLFFSLASWPLQSIAASDSNNASPDAQVMATIQSVIQAQLDAFQRDDGMTAFSFASPSIQRKFGTVSNFMTMVRQGYPAVYRPAFVDFLDARIIAPHTAQAVKFVDQEGRGLIMIYFMEQQEDGQWRIDGVQAIPLNELAS